MVIAPGSHETESGGTGLAVKRRLEFRAYARLFPQSIWRSNCRQFIFPCEAGLVASDGGRFGVAPRCAQPMLCARKVDQSRQRREPLSTLPRLFVLLFTLGESAWPKLLRKLLTASVK